MDQVGKVVRVDPGERYPDPAALAPGTGMQRVRISIGLDQDARMLGIKLERQGVRGGKAGKNLVPHPEIDIPEVRLLLRPG